MPRLYLGIVLHNHQPVGNYGFVFERLYHDAYEPMLGALERHPSVRIGMHNSGPLFDWLAAHRPEYMRRLRALCDRGQVELLTGGYYEPILPMIPDADKTGQIRKMSTFIESAFGQTPTGLWLTERVWEPGLPAPLAGAGVEWTLVDDAHFRMAGMPPEALRGYYLTEDQGQRIGLFAGSQRLRYTIPWLNVEELIEELRAQATDDIARAPYLVLGDDGEKFGGWPTTYEHVWEDGWIERFFSAIEEQGDWLELITPGAYARRFPPLGLTYLPTASYAEMMEWAMPAAAAAEYHRVYEALAHDGRDDVLAYVRGGFWRYFLARYPEANAMHKRGLRIDAKLARAGSDAARDALWQGQCNCPYWHGVFGGLYLRNIRAVTNANLVRAERLADAAMSTGGVYVGERDYDFDGRAEVLLQTPHISLLAHPHEGGMLSEFDFRARDHAALDVLARRREAYHAALTDGTAGKANDDVTNIHGAVRFKQEGLHDALVFDAHRRAGLQEWLLPAAATPESFARGDAKPWFAPDRAWSSDAGVVEGGVVLRMAVDASAPRIEKRIELPVAGERVTVRYTIDNTGDAPLTGRFVSEWNISAPQAPDGDDRIIRLETDATAIDLAATAGAISGAARFVVRGSAAWGIACEPETPCDVWHFPVNTVSSSEGGLELVAQGTSISLTRLLDLAPGASCDLAFAWSAVRVEPAAYGD